MRRPFAGLVGMHPTRRLAVVLAAGALCFFAAPWGGAVFLWIGLAYNVAALTLAVVDARQVGASAACDVSRRPETIISVDEPNPIWIEAANRSPLKLHLIVRDEPPVDFRSPARTLEFDLAPGETLRRNYKVVAMERGDYEFGDLNVRYLTPMGLVARQQTIPCSMQVKVYPDIVMTKQHLLLSRENRSTQMGLRKSRVVGQGMEFERLRDYAPDDSIRLVDWKATARRGIMTSREYGVERCQQVMILIDMGRTMASRTVEADGSLGVTKADCAINAAVLLAHVSALADDRIGLMCFADKPLAFVPPGRGKSQATRLLDELYRVKPLIEESGYMDAFALCAAKQRKRSLVFLFTDLIDADASARLIRSVSVLARRHLVVCVALADYELPTLIESRPQTVEDAYAQSVAAIMIRERKSALAALARQGVITIDASPSDLSIASVNGYLRLKREGRW